MNAGAFGENFPYSNFHDMNMDWVIKIAKDFLDQYTNIQNTINTGLEGLDAKANELEQLLQDWYDTHSADIETELRNALEAINSELTNALGDITDFANNKTAQIINSIPSDYTALSNEVSENTAIKANKKMITSGDIGTRVSGLIGMDGSTSTVGNHIETPITGSSFYLINGYSYGGQYPLYYIKDSSNNVIKYFGESETAYHDLLILTPALASSIVVTGQGSGANGSKITAISSAVDFPTAYDHLHIIHEEVLPNNSDFNNITDNQIIFFGNGYSYSNCPVAEGYLEVTKYTTGLITQEIHTLRGRAWYFRAFYSNIWHDWNPEQMFVMPEYLPADATAVLTSMLNASKYVKLGAGECTVDGLTLPTGAMLEGSGDNTVIKLKADSTNNYAIRLTARNTIANLRIIGSDTEYSPIITMGTRNGIYLTGNAVYTNKIQNVSISNFDGRGIYLYETGANHRDCALINNVFISNCCAGLCLENSEYCRANNVNIYTCYYACINNGGNNIFTGCTFHGFQCFVIDNTSESYPNNGHGSCVGCSFNHAMGNIPTGDYAILMKFCTNGFLFSGCQCFFSRVDISDSKGIMFTGCEFGRDQVIRIIDCTEAQLNGCIFMNDADHMPTIQRTSSTLQVVNCYTQEGTAIN